MSQTYYVYMVTNANKTTLYIGMTNNLQIRLSQHYTDSQKAKRSFAGKYNCYFLVFYESFENVLDAIRREKELKKWRRAKKEQLIQEVNPDWDFLNDSVF
ncbi:MAG: GIY-YIG nuclease family protein [Bacteroidota bacterium]